ncbi:hypothetical protein [Calothrix rhizosoleniae]|uniref:hypothetical protein n=1 Tax=Calothrix rhizosoleniae TaxID=888997 RepID=UPI000B49C32B|nr:hypothetical protein [Calothrix rhizosoleniae]
MSITILGTIQRRDIGMGAWALVSEEGVTYEIFKGADAALLHPELKARVTGQIREDVMTMAMIGPVLEVESFEIMDSD